MFTGIIEEIGEVTAIEREKSNVHLQFKSKNGRSFES